MRSPRRFAGAVLGLAVGLSALACLSASAAPPVKHLHRFVPAPAAASASVSTGVHVYAGNTAPAFTPMTIQVRGSRLRQIAVMHSTDCFAYASRLSASALRRARIARNGRFHATVVTSLVDSPHVWWNGERYPDQVTEMFKGRVSGGQARGTLRATLSFLDGSTCTTGQQRWLLTRKRGRIFGGLTSQSMPVSVELDAAGGRIRHLHIGWIARCTDGSVVPLADFLTNFTLTAGAVDETFRQEFPSSGGTVRFDYHLRAAAHARTSTGKLDVTVTELAADGTVTDSCATPTVRWNATSG